MSGQDDWHSCASSSVRMVSRRPRNAEKWKDKGEKDKERRRLLRVAAWIKDPIRRREHAHF